MSDGWLMDAVQAVWDAEQSLLFECASCHERFVEDDLQQVQPDGRYACPLGCGDGADDPPLFIVIPWIPPSAPYTEHSDG